MRTKRLLTPLVLLTILNILITTSLLANSERIVIEEADFLALSHEMKIRNKGLLLMIHSEGCTYCEAMDANILSPMIRSGEYEKRIFIRKLRLDKKKPVINFQGSSISAFDLANNYSALFTPTLLFLDRKGIEKTEKLIGLNNINYIGASIDKKIDSLLASIKTKKDST